LSCWSDNGGGLRCWFVDFCFDGGRLGDVGRLGRVAQGHALAIVKRQAFELLGTGEGFGRAADKHQHLATHAHSRHSVEACLHTTSFKQHGLRVHFQNYLESTITENVMHGGVDRRENDLVPAVGQADDVRGFGSLEAEIVGNLVPAVQRLGSSNISVLADGKDIVPALEVVDGKSGLDQCQIAKVGRKVLQDRFEDDVHRGPCRYLDRRERSALAEQPQSWLGRMQIIWIPFLCFFLF